jgi:hypothetical protein
MENLLYIYQIPKLNQNQINDLSIPISPKEIETVINGLPTKKKKKKKKKAKDQMGLVHSSVRPSKKT